VEEQGNGGAGRKHNELRHENESEVNGRVPDSKRRRGVVTGAARGIGRAVVRRLIREGVDVLAVDIDEAGLRESAGAGCETLVADVADQTGRQRLAAAADDADYLVNAAGIIRIKPIFEITVEDWRQVLAVNAESTFFLCQAIGPRMRPGGAIVNLSSSSAKLATTTEAAVYAASKTAILSITRSFAYALAPRPVRVNAICPGIIDTPMQDHVLEHVSRIRGLPLADLSAARNRTVPLGRAASADECAGAIWFLLSDESAYMTGQAVNFTGGLVMW
jgi:NAD(P)-dependent dehydrogenase (short-subunit alcohol dehydrogenase family)